MKKYISTIDHSIRIKLKLNCLEYCLVEYLSKLGSNSKENANKMLESIGITMNQCIDMMLKLEEMGLLISDNNRVAMVTTKWTCCFKNKIGAKTSFPYLDMEFKRKFAISLGWGQDKLKFYWDAATQYSNEGNRYIDWIGAVRNWAARDEKIGRYKFKENLQPKQTMIIK